MTSTSKPITRSDYMSGNATHSEYYAQFVTPEVIATVRRHIGEAAIKKSTDPHFNDIPLAKWDRLSFRVSGMKEAGDYLTLSSIVCIAKEAARQIANRS